MGTEYPYFKGFCACFLKSEDTKSTALSMIRNLSVILHIEHMEF